ncbi:mucin-5AC-like [Schistocerca gregaria]|uniref:mucin-5AC-like n=1 Tax=Schistocerca gregaria TaxID=7010 RepID=UPI00211DF95E|nr:mucin-5AC-like [Schistocerca gregaria]
MSTSEVHYSEPASESSLAETFYIDEDLSTSETQYLYIDEDLSTSETQYPESPSEGTRAETFYTDEDLSTNETQFSEPPSESTHAETFYIDEDLSTNETQFSEPPSESTPAETFYIDEDLSTSQTQYPERPYEGTRAETFYIDEDLSTSETQYSEPPSESTRAETFYIGEDLTTSETPYSEQPLFGTGVQTFYIGNDLTCPAWSTQTKAAISDSSIQDIIRDDSTSSVPRADTSDTSEYITLDVTSHGKPSYSTSTELLSHGEYPTIEAITTDTYDTEQSDEPLTVVTDGNGLQTNPSSVTVSTTIEEIHTSSMRTMTTLYSIQSTEYNLLGEASTVVPSDSQSTDTDSTTSNVSQFTIEPSTLPTSGSQITEESTMVNQEFTIEIGTVAPDDLQTTTELAVVNRDFDTDCQSTNARDVDTEISLSNVPQSQESTMLHQDRTDWSRPTARNTDTEVSNMNVSQFSSKTLYARTEDIILASSTNVSPVSDSLPSPGIASSSSKSPLSTPLAHEVAYTTRYKVHSVSLDGAQRSSVSDWPVPTAAYSGTKYSSSDGPQLGGKAVATTSTSRSPGSVPLPTTVRRPTAVTEHTKQRTCKRLVKTSPGDPAGADCLTPPLTLRRTSRRRLKITRPPAA